MVRQVKDYDNRTPLHISSSVGDLESTKLLIWNHADVNALDRLSLISVVVVELLRENCCGGRELLCCGTFYDGPKPVKCPVI